MKVMQLDWINEGDMLKAYTPFDTYYEIKKRGSKYCVCYSESVREVCYLTIEECKDVAQGYFEERVEDCFR